MIEALMRFEVTPDGGEPFEVSAYSRDVLLWEKAGRNRSFSQLQENLSMVDLYGLAHVAARRQSMFSGTLQEMETTCDLTPLSTNEDEDEDDEVDPTRPAA